MKLKFSHFFAASAVICAVSLVGCGGGSSSGPSTPSATATPIPTNITVTVQLRDSAGALVEGLVTLGTQRRATTGGNASFTNISSGANTATAEVNGASYSKNFVATPGANTVQISVSPTVTATPGGTPPGPPAF